MKKNCSVILLAAVVALSAFSSPANAGKTDDRIEASAQKSYVFKVYLKGDDIKVQSHEGAVTLTGVVTDESHKSLAQETVAGLPGVKSVDNRLDLKGATPSANSDAWLRDKVKATLMFHRSVNAAATQVDVKDGIVTLCGVAANQAQKELTAEYTKDLDGVKDVVNEMIVATPPIKSRTLGDKIDDASITAMVKTTLLYHRSTSALNTKVVTRLGIVSLDGKARNMAEVNLATKLAGDVTGVRSVSNRMIVD